MERDSTATLNYSLNTHAADQTRSRPRRLHCGFDLAAPSHYHYNSDRFSFSFAGQQALKDTVENAPSGWDSWLRVGQFDPIAKTSKFTDHSPGTLALRLFASGWASFLVTDSLVQNLPDQAAKPVGNDPDSDVVA